MILLKQLSSIIDHQYQQPKGVLGRYIGEKMIRQHKPETHWTIELLNLQENEEILEIGCGAGYAMKLLSNQPFVHKVMGLDLSKTLLHSSSIRNFMAIRKGRAQVVLGNVHKLPFKDKQFSKVFSIHSVYFWGNLPEAMAEIYRVLKPNGSVSITLCEGKNGESWDTVKNMIENELIPHMKQTEFINVRLLKGPDSRGYHTVAITGER
ncbi:methyltransferase domain-containing protein [Bacillus hwajinpoensis]|uniref:Methyltransferase domain-containing protein n=1 Tax=Guptibacillus hwajinpoensis TaxID=208199 RepID=A0A845EY23_9BACL|nr:class I SAM-dependent methyltransferase [Pseudalkalibacillus hwajinpoensis]MYL63492.1 methyltransferase domain-containing protein [Pseudalkalibacillus hwajinpoensis]